MSGIRVKSKRLTFEACESAAKQCTTLKQFYKEHVPEYNKSRAQGWLARFDWLKRIYHVEWDHDSCRAAALKYTTKKDFREGNPGAYSVARDKGWLDGEFSWLRDLSIDIEYGRIYSVYRYEFDFEGKKFEYIGLTMRPNERDRRHHEQDSSVREFAEAHHIPIPPMRIIERNLTQAEARHKEDYYRKIFEAAGYEILNRAPTGDSVGSVGGMHRKWTKAACLSEARKYRTAGEFRRVNNSAYLACTRHKWISLCTWFEDGRLGPRKNTKEYCEKCARQFETIAAFREKYPSAYQVSKASGWLASYSWLLHRGELSQSVQAQIVELYRKGQDLKTIARSLDLKLGAVRHVVVSTIPSEYRGKRASVIDEQKVLADLKQPWDGAKQEFAAMHGFPSVDSLSLFLRAHGIAMQYRKYRLSRAECYELAKKCRTRGEFRKLYSGAYGRSRKEGWINDYDWFENGRIKWTIEACKQESKKYRTKAKFKAGCPTAYHLCCKNGWMPQMGPFENGKLRIYKWTEGSCTEEAKKYIKISDFVHKALGAYKFAKRHDLLKTFTWFSQYIRKERKRKA